MIRIFSQYNERAYESSVLHKILIPLLFLLKNKWEKKFSATLIQNILKSKYEYYTNRIVKTDYFDSHVTAAFLLPHKYIIYNIK